MMKTKILFLTGLLFIVQAVYIYPQNPIGYVDEIIVEDTDFQWINLCAKGLCFENPVVVAKPMMSDDSRPAVVRIDEITQTSFKIRLQRFDYQSDEAPHGNATVGYLVLEAGHHYAFAGPAVSLTGDERPIVYEAGVVETNQCVPDWRSVTFSESFPDRPVIITTVVSYDAIEPAALVTRIRNVTEEGFEVALQHQGADEQSHTTIEQIAYVAVCTGQGKTGESADLSYYADITDSFIGHNPTYLPFPFGLFSVPPIFLSDMQTTEESDPAQVRLNDKEEGYAIVKIEEEDSDGDGNTEHTGESIGYVAFQQSTAIYKRELDLAFIIDASGSISDGEWQLQMDGFAEAVQNVMPRNGSVSLAVIIFSTNASIFKQLTTITQTNYEDISSEIADMIQPIGWTRLDRGIEKAVEALSEGSLAAEVRRVLLISTDGRPEDSSGESVPRSYAITAADNAFEQGFEINAIGVGGGADNSFLANHIVKPGPVTPGPCDELSMSGSSFECSANNFYDFASAVQNAIGCILTGEAELEIGPGPNNANYLTGYRGIVRIPALNFKTGVSADVSSDATIESFTFQSIRPDPCGNDAMDIWGVTLVEDVDQDGRYWNHMGDAAWSFGDFHPSEHPFTEDGGQITFHGIDRTVSPGETVHWLVLLDMATLLSDAPPECYSEGGGVDTTEVHKIAHQYRLKFNGTCTFEEDGGCIEFPMYGIRGPTIAIGQTDYAMPYLLELYPDIPADRVAPTEWRLQEEEQLTVTVYLTYPYEVVLPPGINFVIVYDESILQFEELIREETFMESRMCRSEMVSSGIRLSCLTAIPPNPRPPNGPFSQKEFIKLKYNVVGAAGSESNVRLRVQALGTMHFINVEDVHVIVESP